MWTQIVGKVRMSQAPFVNHWWQVTLYASPRGLTTGAIPHGGRLFDLEFDFCEHQLLISTSDGQRRTIRLEPKPVAEFYHQVMDALDQLGFSPVFRPSPTRWIRRSGSRRIPTTPRMTLRSRSSSGVS